MTHSSDQWPAPEPTPDLPAAPPLPAPPATTPPATTPPTPTDLAIQSAGRRATWGVVAGALGLLGCCFLLPLALGPLAWYLGLSARRDLERADDPRTATATTAWVLGAVTTGLAVVMVLVLLGMAGLIFVTRGTDTGY